ncbi:unnamed protein product [Adineta ricciae]|uniref:YHYH domain-containing protein n=1 Tax=Adineta ricciae TaxID=249248 RepID=A0A815WBV4_ADIRI|nr:unnamed protein product [Adineta ricciae]CAF1541875.1 unnamed protein product [Adineta ricciae]
MASQRICLITLVLFYAHFANVQSATSNSLSDCQAVASSFRTTINYTASNITATTGVNVTCSQSSLVCPGQTINGVCVWQRKLSAVCRNASGTIKIRIQTNGLPPRCADVPSGTFSELNVDFEVNFNPSVSINSLNQNFSSISTLSQTICTLTSVSTVPSASGFVSYGATLLATASGVSVDGVMIFSPDSANNIDPFYPPAGGTAESVDACLAHCQVSGVYHYHIATGCQVNPPTGNVSSCASTSACSSSVSSYSISSFSSYQTKTVIGLAKDGHVIYGPYLSAGTRVTSGFDACNGMFYDSNGNYAYFATSTYPYLAGCFGPANYPSFGPNCTTNGPSNYTMSSYALALLSNSTNSSTTVSSSNSTTTVSSSNSTTTTTRRSSSMAIHFNLNIFLLLLTLIVML